MKFIWQFYWILKRKVYLSKMNNLPIHHGAGPQKRGAQCSCIGCIGLRSALKTGPSKVGDVFTPPGPWTNFGPLSRGCRLWPEGLSPLLFPGTFWTHGRINIAGISRLREVAWHPGLYGFQTCVLCYELSHRELFANIPSLPFILLAVFFQASPKIYDYWLVRIGTKTDLKTESFAFFEISRFATTKQ